MGAISASFFNVWPSITIHPGHTGLDYCSCQLCVCVLVCVRARVCVFLRVCVGAFVLSHQTKEN